MMGRSAIAPAVASALLFGLLVIIYSTSDSTTELYSLDGIQLDPNAVSQLTGGDSAKTPSYVHLSHESGHRINKLLKKDEKGEIDGIALDSRAEAELGDSHVSIQHRHSERASSSKKKRVSRAQTLLDEGKENLDSSNWQDAVKLFAKAEAIWKRHGNEDYHWAASLKNDVLRAHPELAAQKPGSPGMSEHQLEVKDAEKQLSSGHAFRSLYGLLREKQAAKMGAPPHMQSSSPSALRPASAQTASLSETPQHSPNSVTQRIDAATKSAIQTLEQQNQALLKKEETAILYQAEEEKRRALARQQHRAHRHQLRLAAAAKAPQAGASLASRWESSSGPPPGASLRFRSAGAGQGGAELAQGREQQLAAVPQSMVMRQAQPQQQQLQYQYPQQQQQQQQQQQEEEQQQQQLQQQQQQQRGAVEYQYPQEGAVEYQYPQGGEQGAVQQSLAAASAGARPEAKQAVPVINLNLPPGQSVPAGQYEMDGSLVEDLAGHWDFVGNLEPKGPAIVPQ